MLKQLSFSVSLFVVSIFFTLTVKYFEGHTSEDVLTLMNINEVQRVEIQTSQDILSFNRVGNIWQYGVGEADPKIIKQFIESFKSGNSVYKEFQSQESSDKYGLNSPAAVVTFMGKGGQKQTVSFGEFIGNSQGEKNIETDMVYVKTSMLPNRILLVKSFLLTEVLKPAFHFQSKEIWQIQRLGLRQVKISSTEHMPFTLYREASGWLLKRNSNQFKADRQIFDSYLGNLLSWSAEAQFQTPDINFESLQFLGAIELMQDSNIKEKVKVYSYDKVILVEKNNYFYQISLKKYYTHLFPSFEFFLNRNIFDGVSLEKASRFTHSGLTFSKAGAQWFREQENNGELASQTATASQLLNRLDEKKLSDLIEELSALRARATYVLGGQQSLVKLGFKPNFPHFIVHIDDRKSVLKIFLSNQATDGNDGYIWLQGEGVVYGLKEDKLGSLSSYLRPR